MKVCRHFDKQMCLLDQDQHAAVSLTGLGCNNWSLLIRDLSQCHGDGLHSSKLEASYKYRYKVAYMDDTE